MANTTKRSPQSAGRFGRPGASSTPTRRVGRPGTSASKPPRGKPRSGPLWTGYGGKKAPSRFSRGTKKSAKGKGLAGTLTGLIPTGAASKATPGSKKGKAGGLAALAAAAGVAFRNREKLTSMIGNRGGGTSGEQPATTTTTTAPETTPTSTVPRPDDGGSVPRPQ